MTVFIVSDVNNYGKVLGVFTVKGTARASILMTCGQLGEPEIDDSGMRRPGGNYIEFRFPILQDDGTQAILRLEEFQVEESLTHL